MGRSSVKPRVSVQDSTGTSDLWTRAHLCSHLQATNILALGLDHLLEHEAVGRTVSLTQGPGTDCSTTLTSGGAIPSPSDQGDYPAREGVWFTRLRPVPETEAVHVCVFACCKSGRCEVLLALVWGRRTLCRPVALLLRSRSAGLLSAIVIR